MDYIIRIYGNDYIIWHFLLFIFCALNFSTFYIIFIIISKKYINHVIANVHDNIINIYKHIIVIILFIFIPMFLIYYIIDQANINIEENKAIKYIIYINQLTFLLFILSGVMSIIYLLQK